MIRTRLQGDTPFFPNMLNNGKVEVCLKEDVDKVIAEKDKEIADLIEKNKRLANKDIIMASNAIKDVFKELRHHKYKRCLDKARWCNSEENRLDAIAPLFDTDKECWEYNSDYWNKWHKHWLKLAEKFKPNSTLQQKD